MGSIKCGKCGGTHTTVIEVRACYGQQQASKPRQATTTAATPKQQGQRFEDDSTPKQRSFIASLRQERGMEAGSFAGTKREASEEISRLLAMPKAQQPKATRPEPEDGIYLDPAKGNETGTIFKVYKMVHGSGRQGVKRLVINEDQTGTFDYCGLAVKHLPETSKKMTLEEAKMFGSIYGFCVRCGATLTDENSIEQGIGPVCATKF